MGSLSREVVKVLVYKGLQYKANKLGDTCSHIYTAYVETILEKGFSTALNIVNKHGTS